MIACDYWNPLKPLKYFNLCKETLRVYAEPNAGGKSVNSEALSMEYVWS